MKSKLKIIFINLAVFLVLGEILTRIFIPPLHSVQHLHFNTTQIDEEIGWLTIANKTFKDTVQDAGGEAYVVDYQTVKDGFRMYGKLDSDTLKKVWFIGDSYTQSVEVSNDKTFYHHLKDSLPIEVFAYGASGHGTLQEYLIFEKYVEQIQPDLVVWQYCSNDFIDNYDQLEMEAGYKIGARRPYLNLDGSIENKMPLSNWLKISEYSRLGYGGYILWQKMKNKLLKEEMAEYYIAHQRRNYQPFDQAVQITDLILKKITNKLPAKTQVLFFSADNYDPQLTEFKELCGNNNFAITENPVNELIKAKMEKVTVHAYDGYHWNEKGHEVIANGLLSELRKILFGR